MSSVDALRSFVSTYTWDKKKPDPKAFEALNSQYPDSKIVKQALLDAVIQTLKETRQFLLEAMPQIHFIFTQYKDKRYWVKGIDDLIKRYQLRFTALKEKHEALENFLIALLYRGFKDKKFPYNDLDHKDPSLSLFKLYTGVGGYISDTFLARLQDYLDLLQEDQRIGQACMKLNAVGDIKKLIPIFQQEQEAKSKEMLYDNRSDGRESAVQTGIDGTITFHLKEAQKILLHLGLTLPVSALALDPFKAPPLALKTAEKAVCCPEAKPCIKRASLLERDLPQSYTVAKVLLTKGGPFPAKAALAQAIFLLHYAKQLFQGSMPAIKQTMKHIESRNKIFEIHAGVLELTRRRVEIFQKDCGELQTVFGRNSGDAWKTLADLLAKHKDHVSNALLARIQLFHTALQSFDRAYYIAERVLVVGDEIGRIAWREMREEKEKKWKEYSFYDGKSLDDPTLAEDQVVPLIEDRIKQAYSCATTLGVKFTPAEQKDLEVLNFSF